MLFQISPKTRKLGAWNWWLLKIYGQRVLVGSILLHGGLSQEEVDRLTSKFFDAYVESLVEYLRNVDTGRDSARKHDVMVRHYGLATGYRESLQSIGNDYGVSRERIRQLVEKRLGLFRTQQGVADLEKAMVARARKLLEDNPT